jgi:hypothetical protein
MWGYETKPLRINFLSIPIYVFVLIYSLKKTFFPKNKKNTNKKRTLLMSITLLIDLQKIIHYIHLVPGNDYWAKNYPPAVAK